MKAIILAAGYATRLYPLTINTPKPLLEVGGKSIIDHILGNMKGIPLSEVIVVTNDKFHGHFLAWKEEKGELPFTLTILNDGTTSNDNRLGAVGDVLFAIDQCKIDEELLVIGGDNLFEVSLEQMHKKAQETQAAIVALYDMKDPTIVANKFGVVSLGEGNKLMDFEEKPTNPKSSLTATACYLFTKENLKDLQVCIEQHGNLDNSGDFIKYLVENKHVYGHPLEGRWFDIGSHEQLEEAKRHFL